GAAPVAVSGPVVTGPACLLGVSSGLVDDDNGADPTRPPSWPPDLIDAACAWIAAELGEPAPVRHPACRPLPTSRRRRP
ncbi:hypothetical protein ACWEH1_01945, partial [Micromonospora chersina]